MSKSKCCGAEMECSYGYQPTCLKCYKPCKLQPEKDVLAPLKPIPDDVDVMFTPIEGSHAGCDWCGICSFRHIHRAGTLPKDLERVEDLIDSSHVCWCADSIYHDQEKDCPVHKTKAHKAEKKAEKCEGFCQNVWPYGFVPEADCPVHDKPEPQPEKCECKEMSCPKDCNRKHTCHLYSCDKCGPTKPCEECEPKQEPPVMGCDCSVKNCGMSCRCDNHMGHPHIPKPESEGWEESFDRKFHDYKNGIENSEHEYVSCDDIKDFIRNLLRQEREKSHKEGFKKGVYVAKEEIEEVFNKITL